MRIAALDLFGTCATVDEKRKEVPMKTDKELYMDLVETISSDRIKEDVKTLIGYLPEYFWKVPASSTGKYHPKFTLGDGGLVRHTIAACMIAYELLEVDIFSDLRGQSDLIIAALLLHDGFKHGWVNDDGTYSEYSCEAHPRLMASVIRRRFTTSSNMDTIADMVERHMGQWNNIHSYDAKEHQRVIVDSLPKPSNSREQFVHLCDYLASRRMIEVDIRNKEPKKEVKSKLLRKLILKGLNFLKQFDI